MRKLLKILIVFCMAGLFTFPSYAEADSECSFHDGKNTWKMIDITDQSNISQVAKESQINLQISYTMKPRLFCDSEGVVYAEFPEGYEAQTQAYWDRISTIQGDVEFLKQWVLDNTQYNHNWEQDHMWDTYDALFSGQAICTGYSKLFRDLCKANGIACKVVVGWTSTGEYHAWNEMGDGAWVDLTYAETDPAYKLLTESQRASRIVENIF